MSNNNVQNKAHACNVLHDNDWQFIPKGHTVARDVGTRFIASAHPHLSGANLPTPFTAPTGQYGTLVLEDGTRFEGKSFGYTQSQAGEVVFSTGMFGSPEAFTVTPFPGHILPLTSPLPPNYRHPKQTPPQHNHL